MSNEEFWQKLDEERTIHARKFHIVIGIVTLIALVASIGFIATLNAGIMLTIIFAIVDSICIGYICYASANDELGFKDFGDILGFIIFTLVSLWILFKIMNML